MQVTTPSKLHTVSQQLNSARAAADAGSDQGRAEDSVKAQFCERFVDVAERFAPPRPFFCGLPVVADVL
jgi:hypothetical protein